VSILTFIRDLGMGFWTYTIYGVMAFALGIFGVVWSKHPLRWLVGVAVVGLAVVLYRYEVPPIDELLPATFREYFRVWVFVLGVLALLTTSHLVGTAVRRIRGDRGAASGQDAPFADIDAAWQEVRIQLSRARIDLSQQPIYLLLTPDEALAAWVVNAAGLQFFARAPTAPDAPLHAYAVSDALFVSCGGAYAGAGPVAAAVPAEGAPERPASDGAARLEHLCRLIVAENPERPTLRGIAVLIPYEWTRGTDSLMRVSAIRDDLQTVRQVSRLCCPTLTVFCVRDGLPGFNEFTTRLPARERQMRCGFSVPTTMTVGGPMLQRGADWIIRWFELWSLNLMVGDVRNTLGNCRLLAMNLALHENRNNLVGLLEAALTVHSQAEPVLYRGSYFVSYGHEPERNAFASGLLNGARKGRLLVDRDLTRWSRDADRLDRGYRLAALALGLIVGGGSAAVWVLGVVLRLRRLDPSWMWAGVVGLALLALTWLVVLLVPRFRGRGPTVAAPASKG